jgi:hypothetical protein
MLNRSALREVPPSLICKALRSINTADIGYRNREAISASRLTRNDVQPRRTAMPKPAAHEARSGQIEEVLELARSAGLLITLDGQIGREKYQSIAGSLTSFMRFVEALRASMTESAPA